MWKNLFIISLLGCYHICNSQENNQEFDQYNWLGDRYSSEVIEWVDQQNRKSLDYLDSIKLLSYLEQWQVNFEKKYDWENMKRVPMEVNQVGQYAELVRGDTWHRMKFEKYLKNKAPDFRLNIERLGLNAEMK